ncbi:PIN domain-containing protein [Salisaeta longa]|uniref:PIN domain-containing protein n=1 Tax=Salisaeta longa TaxID=503170 RepID=UPI0003FE2843|nr:PIN domain-containing protein [Salisaeta longa]
MAERPLFDTSVLVDYLRGRDDAIPYIESRTGPLLLPTVVVAELYAGVRDGKREALATTLRAFDIYPVTASIAKRGGLFKRDY